MKKQTLTLISITVVLAAAGVLLIGAAEINEKKEVTHFLDSFRKTYESNDYNAWTKHWEQTDEALFTYTTMEKCDVLQGWDAIYNGSRKHFDRKLSNMNTRAQSTKFRNRTILVEGKMAWVDAEELCKNGKGEDYTIQKCTHTLKKINGDWKMININIIIPGSYQEGKIVVNTNRTPDIGHVHLDDFPEGGAFPMIEGWGGMSVDKQRVPAGTDFSPMLQGLKNDLCQVPHWGYIIKGAVEMEYDDGTREVIREGEVFYSKPGHTGKVMDDLLLISFSPEKGMQHLHEHFMDKISQMN
jgi:hypothetical protein